MGDFRRETDTNLQVVQVVRVLRIERFARVERVLLQFARVLSVPKRHVLVQIVRVAQVERVVHVDRFLQHVERILSTRKMLLYKQDYLERGSVSTPRSAGCVRYAG